MSNALSGFLAGVEQGTRTGLSMYQTIQGEKRAQREEQYRAQRDAIADERWEKTWDRQQERDEVLDGQWNSTFDENVRQYNETLAENARQADQTYKVSMMNAQTNAGNLALNSHKWRFQEAAYKDAEQTKRLTSLVTAMSVGDDGLPLKPSDPLFAQRLSALPPDAVRHMMVASGMRTAEQAANYSGVRFSAGPGGGVVVEVQGKDAAGKPIEGWKPLTMNGTSADDDEIPVLSAESMLAAFNPNYATNLRENALMDSNIAAGQAAVDATADSRARSNGATAGDIAGLTAQLAERQEQLRASTEELGRQIGDMSLASTSPKTLEKYGIPQIQSEIQSLSGALRRAESNAQSIQLGRDSDKSAVAEQERRTRLSAGAPGNYQTLVAGRPATAKKAAEERAKTVKSTVDYLASTAQGGFTAKSMEKLGIGGDTKAKLTAQLMNMPEYIEKAATDPLSMAALMNASNNFLREGGKGSVEAHLAAGLHGVDPAAFDRAYNDQALHGLAYEQRVQEALKRAQRDNGTDR